MKLTVLEETGSAITLGWTPPTGQTGYVAVRDGSELIDGKRRFSFSDTAAQVKIGKPQDGLPHTYGVKILGDIAEGVYPEPPAPPATKGRLGIILNDHGNYDKAEPLGPKVIRADKITQGLVDWCAAKQVLLIGLATNMNATQGLAFAKKWPQITTFEGGNEPYYIQPRIDAAAWARDQLAMMQSMKAWNPAIKFLLPMYVQSDGGDFPVYQSNPQVWKPWTTLVFDAAPGLKDVDGFAVHPYSSPRNAPPSLAMTDKVRGQLLARGVDKPFHLTEFGWSVGSGGDQVSAAVQASYIADMVTVARMRPWVETMELYCLNSWGTGFEPSFGVLNPDGSARPSAATFKALA